MLAILGIGLGLIIGLVSRGSMRALASAEIPAAWTLVGLFAAQAAVRGPLFESLGEMAIPLWGALLLVLLVVLWRPQMGAELWACGLGLAANLLVIIVNGHMPVVASAVLPPEEVSAAITRFGGFYRVAGPDTRLVWLGDIIPLGPGLASIGDVVLALGVAAYIVRIMHAPRRVRISPEGHKTGIDIHLSQE